MACRPFYEIRILLQAPSIQYFSGLLDHWIEISWRSGQFLRLISAFNTMEKYLNARHIIVEPPTRKQGLLETFLQKRGIHRKAALTTPHFMSMSQILSSTDLIATVPDAIAESFAENSQLAQLPLPFHSPVFDSHLHWSKSVNNDPAHRWLRGILFDAFVSRSNPENISHKLRNIGTARNP